MTTLTETIRNRRKELGMTQRELAEKLGISDKTVSRWESGVQIPDALLIPAIAEVLELRIDALYGMEDPLNEPEENAEKPREKKSPQRRLFDFRIIMIAGMLTSLLGALVHTYFTKVVYAWQGVYSIEYYQTAKGALADFFAFAGIVLVFAGIALMLVGKVRFSMQFKSPLDDAAFLADLRCTGCCAVVLSVIVVKIVPDILSIGFYVPRYVYGFAVTLALTILLLVQKKRLLERTGGKGKLWTIAALVVGTAGFLAEIAVNVLSTYAVMNDGTIYNSMFGGGPYAVVSVTLLAVADFAIIAMPVTVYIELLVKSGKWKGAEKNEEQV